MNPLMRDLDLRGHVAARPPKKPSTGRLKALACVALRLSQYAKKPGVFGVRLFLRFTSARILALATNP